MIAVAAAAAILGDNVGFAIGRKLGRRLLTAPGPVRCITAGASSRSGEPFFDRHGPKAVFLGRWVTGLRITAAWMAGVHADVVADLPVLERARRHLRGRPRSALLAYFAGHSAEKLIHIAGLGGRRAW